MPADAAEDNAAKRRNTVEVVATILLAAAAVATAWSSYQANRWNGEQAKAASTTNGLRIRAARAESLADDQRQVDVATYIQWVDAYATGDTNLQRFYEDRFRDEFKPAFEAWKASQPFANSSAPRTPFVMKEYQVAAAAESVSLDAASEASSAEARRDIQRSANFVLAVVLFAVVLFFAGVSTKLTSTRLQRVLVTLGCALFGLTVAWVATFPVRFSV